MREGWFPACMPLKDQPTSRERCPPRGIRPCMQPDHKGTRVCRLCSVRSSRIGAGGNAPGSAASRRAGSSADSLRPHPDPWAEPCEPRTAYLPSQQLEASDPLETDHAPKILKIERFIPGVECRHSLVVSDTHEACMSQVESDPAAPGVHWMSVILPGERIY